MNKNQKYAIKLLLIFFVGFLLGCSYYFNKKSKEYSNNAQKLVEFMNNNLSKGYVPLDAKLEFTISNKEYYQNKSEFYSIRSSIYSLIAIICLFVFISFISYENFEDVEE